MFVSPPGWGRRISLVLVSLIAATASSLAAAAAAEKPAAGQQVHFPKGSWSGLPQLGPDGKVRQCVMVAWRQRAGKDGPIETRFSVNVSRGSGFIFMIKDEGLPAEQVLDDQAEVLIDNRAFAAVGMPIGTGAFGFHPGDAAGAVTAVGKAVRVRLRSDGAGVDTGAVTIELPAEALNWLKQCSKTFDIAIDKPTDPDAPDMPVARPRSPKISITVATPTGPPGIEDKQKIDGWDASELRNSDGNIIVCFIRRRYVMGPESSARRLATFLMVSRRKGFTVLLKDSLQNLPEGQNIEAALKIGDKPFTAFSAQVQGPDEIAIFPQHGEALAAALENGVRAAFKATADQFEFPVQAEVVP